LRALQFDEVKLVTGSMDHTLRIWNWRTGECISTLEGHTEGVICLNFDSTLIASGSVDTTVKVWNFRTRECFTLRGHRDWVNAVLLWDSGSATSPLPDVSSPHVSPGKMLFSASDDCTIRLWDLTLRTCVRQFTGHRGQVQSLTLLALCNSAGDDPKDRYEESTRLAVTGATTTAEENSSRELKQPQQLLVSGGLDNTVKLWDIDTGKVVRTLFGHLEGVWGVACDQMRLVSGSHDRTIKVRQSSSQVSFGSDELFASSVCRFGTATTTGACRRSSVIPAPSPASLLVRTKLSLEAMMETCGYGRFVYDTCIVYLF